MNFSGPFFLLIFLLLADSSFSQNKDSLYVFVGKRITVEEFIPGDTIVSRNKNGSVTKRVYMDAAFRAKYKIIRNVFNQLNKDTIEFEAYDHYGTPPFSKYQYVLMFIFKMNGKYLHEKYQYFDVYPTIDNRWASPGDPYRFGSPVKNDVVAVPIKFKEPVTFDLTDIKPENIKLLYPEPYYKIKGNKAIALMGNYIDDLFKIKKEGVLKNRGIFN